MKKYCVLLLCILSVCQLSTFAQKLPAKQEVSVYAPNDIKIDGKSTEWGNRFKAYNAPNHLFYTLSNDDKNLYLIVYSREYPNLDKVIYGGITFTISDLNGKTKLKGSSVTYPVADLQRTTPIARTAYEYYFNYKKNLSLNKGKTDTLRTLINKRAETTYKQIQVNGLKGLTEPTVPIYNEVGINAMVLFDSQIALTYELAIPLKYLNLGFNASGETKLKYNIRLNGRSLPNANPNAPNLPVAQVYGPGYLDSPTDFGGEYVLARK